MTPTPARVVRGKKDVNEYAKAYVPPQAVAERYVGRKVEGGISDIRLLDHARENAFNILLEGETGSGKTMLGEAYAAANQYNYYSLPCDVSIDPTALFGKMSTGDTAGKFEWVDGPVTQIVREGGVLNISEGNFMPPKIAASLFPLLDGRRYISLLGHRGEVVRAHHPDTDRLGPCWCDLSVRECQKRWVLVIMDINPRYRGTVDLNAAFKNRFPIKVAWNYDARVEQRLVGVPPLLEIARKIRDKETIRTPVSTNMLLEFVAFATELSYDFAVSNFCAAFDGEDQAAVRNFFNIAKVELERAILAGAVVDAEEEGDDEFEYEDDPELNKVDVKGRQL